MMERDEQFWIKRLKLEPHPEGGYFRETYRSGEVIPESSLPSSFGGPRNVSTAIYYLLSAGTFSAFHSILSDELWHFYEGAPLRIHVLGENGYREIMLGRDHDAGEVLQACVPAGACFAAEPADPDRYSLVGCTVSPGFDFDDFRMGSRDTLSEEYPKHRDLIARLTRL